MCELLPTADGCDPCPFCRLIDEAAASDGIIARLAGRLCNELAVWQLRRETPRPILDRIHLHLQGVPLERVAPKTMNWVRSAILAHLTGGPARVAELALAVHGEAADRGLRWANHRAIRALLAKMTKQGQITRCGRGWYGLPEATGGMVYRSRSDLARTLAHPKVVRNGLTLGELVERFQRDDSTIYYWLRALEQGGHRLVRHTTGGGAGRVVRYWIEAPAAKGAVA